MRRYQHCRFPVRIWRRRWYLLVPFAAVLLHWRLRKWRLPPEPDWPDEVNASMEAEIKSWRGCWRTAISEAQIRMNWLYTMDELMERLDAEAAS